MIYLAGPYSNDAPSSPSDDADAKKRLARFNAVTEVARVLVEDGKIVYSPLTMTHPIDLRMRKRPPGSFWVDFDEAFMQHCSEMQILTLPGWDKSSGVKREAEYFRKKGRAVLELQPEQFGITPANSDFMDAFR